MWTALESKPDSAEYPVSMVHPFQARGGGGGGGFRATLVWFHGLSSHSHGGTVSEYLQSSLKFSSNQREFRPSTLIQLHSVHQSIISREHWRNILKQYSWSKWSSNAMLNENRPQESTNENKTNVFTCFEFWRHKSQFTSHHHQPATETKQRDSFPACL